MKLTFCGAARIVTGSCYLVESGSDKILIDCGMFQGVKDVTRHNYEPFRFDPRTISYVLLTHAHIDHSGLLPKLVKEGFRGKIFATSASIDLCHIMLADSAEVQKSETEDENRRRESEGLPPRNPLYSMDDVQATLPHFQEVEYGRTYSITRNIQARYLDAGHIIGSAIIELFVTENNETKKIVFSGDLGQWDVPIIHDPTMVEEADYVVMESTYGDRLHEDLKQRDDILLSYVKETYNKRGKLLIPSFAVERTQELLYAFNKMILAGKFPDEKVFLDSPLAIKATEIFEKHREFYDREAFKYKNPFNFPNLVETSSVEESKGINTYGRPCVVIAGNGMVTGGRIRHHLRHGLSDPRNTVLFVGYQAEGTLGRQILEGAKSVKMMGLEIEVKAEIKRIDSFSAHADYEELLKWVNGFVQKPKKIFITHGEEASAEEFGKRLTKQGFRIHIPNIGESVET